MGLLWPIGKSTLSLSVSRFCRSLATNKSAHELQAPSSTFYNDNNITELKSRLDKMEAEVREELKKQGFEDNRVKVERMLNMRFEGTDTALMVLPGEDEKDGDHEDFLKAFKRAYKNEFGFLLDGKTIVVDDIKVRDDYALSLLRANSYPAFFIAHRSGE